MIMAGSFSLRSTKNKSNFYTTGEYPSETRIGEGISL